MKNMHHKYSFTPQETGIYTNISVLTRLLALIICVAVLTPAYSAGEHPPMKTNESSISLLPVDTIQGLVSDEEGTTLIGVNIQVKGTTKGTSTDFDGQYTLTDVGDSDTLVVSYIGYRTQQVPVNGRSRINITMRSDAELLDEVVVVGYGTQKKSDLTGAVSTVQSKNIAEMPVTTIEQTLSGQVSGVQMRQNGAPGGGPEILVRGIASTGGNNAPLYVVDGIPLGNVDSQRDNFVLNSIDPSSIESISVLKDAASKAIYGSRASNGVIVITTKEGKKGKPTISFGVNTGYQTIPDFERPKVLNAEQLRQFRIEYYEDREAGIGVLGPAEMRERDRLIALGPQGEGTDWFDAITRNAPMSQYNVGVNGGTDNFRYNISMNYMDQDGTLINTNFKRYSIRANLDVDITDRLRFGLNLAPTQTNASGGRTDAGSNNFNIFDAIPLSRWTDPSAEIYNEDGSFTNVAKGDLIPFYNVNPVYLLEERVDTRKANQFLGGTFVELDIIKGLTAKTFASIQYIDRRTQYFEPSDFPGYGALTPNLLGTRQARAGVGESSFTTLVWENTLQYNTVIDEKHSINALAGFSMEDRQSDNTSINARYLLDESIQIPSSGNTDPADVNNFTGGAGFADNALVSLIGRVNYSYDSRYYLTGTIRRDGSSKFGANKRYGNFPSLAGAWRVSNESFFNSDFISDLKLEAGYGISGSNANIGNYQAQGSISGGQDYIFGGSLAPGSAVGALPNSQLTWEESKETNVGVDIGFANDRFYLSADYYDITTAGFLAGLPLPTTSGFGSILTNLGSIQNKGIELEFRTIDVLQNDNLRWDINVNFTRNKSKVLELAAESGFIRPGVIARAFTETRVGEEVGLYRGFNVTGLFSQDEIDDPDVPKYPGALVGSLQYEDGNGDGVLGDQEDFVIIGNPNPDFNYGLVNNLTYNNLTLKVVIAGSVGGQIYNGFNQYNGNQDGVFNVDTRQLDRWRPGDDPDSKSIPGTASAASRQKYRLPNSLTVQDGDYLWVRNINLGYNFRGGFLSTVVKNARIYTSIQNAFLLTNYPDGNPEINRSGDTALVRNVNYGAYPISRIFTVGLNVTF